MAGLALPFDLAVFFAAMARANAAWFPLALVGLALALMAVALVAHPPAGRERLAARLVGLVLATFALWVAALQQLRLMATFDFMAPIYGWAWIAHGTVVALVVSGLGLVRFAWRDRWDGGGIALVLLGTVGYPLAVLALGHDWRALPLVGTAAQPTAIVTAGLALTARGRARLLLLPLPVAWAGVAALHAHLLSFPLDYTVALAAVIAVVGTFARRRDAAAAPS